MSKNTKPSFENEEAALTEETITPDLNIESVQDDSETRIYSNDEAETRKNDSSTLTAASSEVADTTSNDTKSGAKPKENLKLKEFLRTLKYLLFAASAGLIQMGIAAIFTEGLNWKDVDSNTATQQVLYYVGYVIALVISVIWNFTFNRRYTFQSVANVPRAMGWTVVYYIVFTPCSIVWMKAWNEVPGWGDLGLVVELITVLINGVTEFLFQRLFIYRKSIDNNSVAKKHNEKLAAAQESRISGIAQQATPETVVNACEFVGTRADTPLEAAVGVAFDSVANSSPQATAAQTEAAVVFDHKS